MFKKTLKTKIFSVVFSALVISIVLIRGSNFIFDKINNSSQKVTISKISDNDATLEVNNVVSGGATMRIKKSKCGNEYNYRFYDIKSNNELLNFSSPQNVNFDDVNGYASLAGAAVTTAAAIAGGGAGAVGAGITAVAGVAGAVHGAAWLTAGSVSWVTTLQLAGALALAANPVGVAIGAVGLA